MSAGTFDQVLADARSHFSFGNRMTDGTFGNSLSKDLNDLIQYIFGTHGQPFESNQNRTRLEQTGLGVNFELLATKLLENKWALALSLFQLCDQRSDLNSLINLYTTLSGQTIQLTKGSILSKLVEEYLLYQRVYDILAELSRSSRGSGHPRCTYQFNFTR